MTVPPSVEIPPVPQADGYWAQSREPLASLIFCAPLLIVYEVGILCLGPYGMRNGAEVWLRQFLDAIGFGQYFLLPGLTVCILLGWHYVTRRPWRVAQTTLCGMCGECLVLALCLRLLLHIQGILLQTLAGGLWLSISAAAGSLVGYLGAGVYEELLFRLILLSLVIAVLRWAHVSRRASLIAAVVLVSLAFAGAHHIGQAGEPFRAFYFTFRFLAGVFFSLLFLYRGFGIAAGAHAGYDVLVGLSRLG